MALLSYLAESPLIGFAERLQDTTSSSSSGATSSSGSLVDCVAASPIPRSHDCDASGERIKSEINKLARELENVRDDIEGISQYLDDKLALEIWMVVNDFSNVAHRATINLSTLPSEWRTGCGWQFAGIRHAVTYRQETSNSKFGPCPKCHHLKREDSSDSDSNSSSSSK